MKRNLFSGISQVDFDSNGRFLIPKNMISHCEIERDVILIGVGNIIELWDPKKYKNNLIKDSKEFSTLAQKYLDF